MTESLDHPLRYELVNELHARPQPSLEVPLTAVVVTFKEPHAAAARDRRRDIEHLAVLARRHAAPPPQAGAVHYAAQFGRHALTWESHTEFVSYVAFLPGLQQRPFDPRLSEVFPSEWQAAAPGKRLVALIVHVEALPEDGDTVEQRLHEWFAKDGLAVARVQGGAALVASDFRIDAGGFVRLAVLVRPGTTPARVGRIVQALIDLETYRSMSMLGFGRVQALSAQLNRLEPRLSALMKELAGDAHRPDDTLHELLGVAAELEAAATEVSFRFGATRAYAAITAERLAALRETGFGDAQTLAEFMDRRHAPAMRTVTSGEARLNAMIDRTERAAELLRTRVDVARSAQNRDLLESMDNRADLQLRLQHTVEGLSVVAISYYAVGLLAAMLAPMALAGGIEKEMVSAALVPVVLLAVWQGMRRVRRALREGVPSADS